METPISDIEREHVEMQSSSENLPVEMAASSQSDDHVETEPSLEDPPVETVNSTKSDVGTVATNGTDASSTAKEGDDTGADNIVADSSSANGMDISTHDSAKPNKSPPLSVSSDADMEQTDAYSDDRTLANTNNDSQTPADNDETIEAGNDTIEDLLVSLENLKMREMQTEATKQDVVLKLQPLSDLDTDIWSNKVVQYYIFKADTSAEPPKNEENIALMGYSLWECSKPKKDTEHSVSLRGHKEGDYSLMLSSDLDSEPESGCKNQRTTD